VCGRYAASRRPDELIEEFEIESATTQIIPPSWNVAPTQSVYLIVQNDDIRALEIARWGLIPSWAKDPSIGAKMINARVETVAEKPSFRSAFKSRRCLVPADGYYEWYTPSDDGSAVRRPKQPFYIHRTDTKSLAMAGLYEQWTDPESSKSLTTVTIITTSAVGSIALIHDRMPVLLPVDRFEPWLNRNEKDSVALLDLLAVKDADRNLIATAVSTQVNSVRNNNAGLIEPIPLQ
jgi:putative SOS response-associated peptidase YedK